MTKPCTLCGKCCTNEDFMERIGISAPDTDRWKSEGRNDILAKVSIYSGWVDPGPCPFLADADAKGRRICSIHETRPLTCREYPLFVDHMRYVDCEMLEPGDTDETITRFMQAAAASSS